MTDWTRHTLLAIPDAKEESFLLLPSDTDQWRLPIFDVDQIIIGLHLLQRRLHQELNADMSVLTWIGKKRLEGEAVNHYWMIALMENHNPNWAIPEGAQWFDAQALKTLPLVDEWQREPLLNALSTLKAEAPALRPVWFCKGWFQKAKQWVQSELDAHGYQRSSEIEQYKHWGLSALLRVETNQGLVFFKISNRFPLFANEPKIMETLHQLFPQLIPPLIATKQPERWMLAGDFGTPAWENTQDKDLFLRMARDYAKLQKQTTSPEMHQTLEDAGCFNRRLSILEQQIAPMYLDESSYATLEPEEMSLWKASRPKLIALCQALSRYKIPHTLVHGDFHAGNVAFRGDDLLIFDWTDACIAHPFFDLPVFLEYDGGENSDEVRQTYLAEWLEYEPMDKLEEAYRLAKVGAALHQVISYQGIVNGVEAELQADWASAVVFFIRQIIKALPELKL